MSHKHSLSKSFEFALKGVRRALIEEPNFKIHIAISLIAIVGAFLLGFEKVEWIILILTISSVIILELLNTAVEALVDLLSPEVHSKAEIAKDVSAAAVFIAALASIIVGIFLFLPKILPLL